MRGVLLAAAGLVACSSSSAKSGAAVAGDAGESCVAGALALGGPLAQTPHGVYALGNATLTSSGFSATLPAGGSIVLAWTGDATAGPVPVDGTIVVPLEGTTQSWCVSSASTVQVDAGRGTLQLRVATGADVLVQPNGTCVLVDDAGSQLPLATEPATGCFSVSS